MQTPCRGCAWLCDVWTTPFTHSGHENKEDRGFQRILHRFKSQDGLEKGGAVVKVLEAKLAEGSRQVRVGKEGSGCTGVSPAWAVQEEGGRWVGG